MLLCLPLVFATLAPAADGEELARTLAGLSPPGELVEIVGTPARQPSYGPSVTAGFEPEPTALHRAAASDLLFMWIAGDQCNELFGSHIFGMMDREVLQACASQAMNRGDLRQAWAIQDAMARSSPTSPEVLLREGTAAQLALLQGDADSAESALDRAFELVTQPGDWWTARTRPEHARAVVAEWLARDGGRNHLLYCAKGGSQLGELAARRYRQALQLRPEPAVAALLTEALATLAPGDAAFIPPLSGVPLDDSSFGVCGCFGETCDIRHSGVDLLAPVDTPVFAVADGEVLHVAGPGQEFGWGDGLVALFVRHESAPSGAYVAVYGHVVSSLRPGNPVRAGQTVAVLGRYIEHLEGDRTVEYPSHLHFGVHPGAEMPGGPAGFTPDPMCDAGATGGFVAPFAFLAGGN